MGKRATSNRRSNLNKFRGIGNKRFSPKAHMNWYKKTSQSIYDSLKIENDCYDSRGGEVFCGLLARLPDGTAVGGLDYSIYDKEYHIKMIRTLPEHQRKGIATKLMNELNMLALNDGATVHSGMSTEDGSSFMNSYRELS